VIVWTLEAQRESERKESEREREREIWVLSFKTRTTTATGAVWRWHASDAFYIDSRADIIFPPVNRIFESRKRKHFSTTRSSILLRFRFIIIIIISFFCNSSWTRRAQTDKRIKALMC